MSNHYPPTPSFGGAYTGHSFSDAALRDSGVRTLSAGGGPPAPQHNGNYTPPTSSTPALNNQSFQANAAILNTTHTIPPPIPPPPFHVSPDFFRQFTNSALPPPPYPPVPIPHLGFPQFPAPPPNGAAISTPLDNTLTNTSFPSQQSLQIQPDPQVAPEYQQSSHTFIAKEEGELSDGELDESSPESLVEPTDHTNLSVIPRVVKASNHEIPAAAQATSSISARSKSAIRHALGTNHSAIPEHKDMGNVFQRQSETEDHQMPSADNDSISSYNPPSASTPDPEPDMEPAELRFDAANPSIPARKDHPDTATLILREQVKDALRSLAPHNIKYNELVGEGVDPGILQRLYEDIDQSILPAKPRSPAVEVGRVPDAQTNTRQSPRPAQHIPDLSAADSGQARQDIPTTADTTSTLRLVSSVSETNIVASVRKSPKPLTPAAVSTEKASSAPPSESVAIERKDRIAQLLAARTGKTVLPRPAAEKQQQFPAKSLQSASPVEPAKKLPSLRAKPPLPSPNPWIKPKNIAQTELIRQKMEALKRQALTKAQGQDTMKGLSVAPSPGRLEAQPLQSESVQYAAEVESSALGSQIPGLFMASGAYSSDPNDANERTEHVIAQGVDDSISMGSTATSLNQSISADFVNNLVRSPGGERVLPARLPQKRPLASDSFDEPMPPLKRPFGRKESNHKVEIVVSEDESEGEVEDVEMELDEESDEDKQTQQEDVPVVSLRERNIRNLPPLTDLPSAKHKVQSTSAIGTSASTAAQIPGKEKGKEELWKAKHQEIELMRKKIAEMEERRKAKQNATLAISPKVAEKAPPPVIRTSLTRYSQPARSPFDTKAKLSFHTLQSPILAASRPEDLPSTPSTPLFAIKEPLRADDLRQQLLRRKTTREGTPNAAEVELRQAQLKQKRQRLAELRREAERREAEIVEESRLLEAQLQAGLNDEESDGERSFMNGNVESDFGTSDHAAPDFVQNNAERHGAGESYSSTFMAEPAFQAQSSADEAGSPVRSIDDVAFQPSDDYGVAMETSEPAMISLERDIDAVQELRQDALGSKPPNQEVELMIALRQDISPPALAESGRMDVKSSYPLHEEKPVDDAYPGNISNIPDEDGSVSMSDSASEDYEPAEPGQPADEQPENDSEFYEPADVSADAAYLSSPEQEQVAEPIAVDKLPDPGPQQPTSAVVEEQDHPTLIDDAENGMQLTEPDVIDKSQISQSREIESNDYVSHAISHFTPYETPRRNFKNFRYHDHFPELVSSGYRSLTFNNNIDPRRPFCPTELAGDICEDPTCEEQHFRQVELTDDKILAQMSTANNLKTKAEHERWVAGLRQVIADLRSKGVKDFHMVASALAAYRRRFSEELSTPTSASSQS